MSPFQRHVRETALKERWNEAPAEVEALLHRDRYRQLLTYWQWTCASTGRAERSGFRPRQGWSDRSPRG